MLRDGLGFHNKGCRLESTAFPAAIRNSGVSARRPGLIMTPHMSLTDRIDTFHMAKVDTSWSQEREPRIDTPVHGRNPSFRSLQARVVIRGTQ